MKPTQTPTQLVTETFNGGQLRLARHFWGKTLNDVAVDIDKTRQYVSQLETGKAKPRSDDPIVLSLADSLQVMPAFFYKSAGTLLSEDQAHFRKLATTKTSTRQRVLAMGTIFDQLVEFFDTKVRLPDVDFPDESGAHTAEEIELAAERVRRHWSLGVGPIAHMVRVVESAGAVVAFFKDASTEVDALSITSRRPVIVRNDAKASPFRMRFDIAHELGHLVLHEGHVTGDRKTESEANRFASAFLLPRSTFLKVFPKRGTRIDWAGIRALKLEFQVSKAAILYRAKSLELLDDDQYRGAVITLKNRGEAIQEAEDAFCQKEEAEIVIKALEVLRVHHKLSREAVAKQLDVKPALLAQILPVSAEIAEPPRAKPVLQLVK
ncbi:Zn-dependent peptidase ImmA (M78 family) [Pseudoxanthomonas japonensis]|uniref:helix-turn-helix domain-containing protein n=1 Tax=Pseudoxanthomonas japonensis TaxID=69284 RepID=UPI0028646256|nr:XRE family transcriptional regulator [Pseudoxanthomonas japonensis]MDR7070484.1 Zn-dependent peptidase ImmA (M78 family) [Pseudoxanthomonas japonensis]